MALEIDLQPGDKILISRTDRLGDLILALPFVETIKRRYPECRVDVLASLYASPILENNPHIDRIVRVQNDQLWTDNLYKKDLLHRIRMEGYRAVVALYPERQISQLFQRAEIPIRIGTARRFHSIYFTHHVTHSRKANVKHEYEYNLDFLQFFRDGETVASPKVYLRERELRNARRILDDVGAEESFVVIHPGSRGSAERWPPERFIELYCQLSREGLSVVLSGSEEEGQGLSDLTAGLPVAVRDISGQTDLRTLAAVLSQARVVVANSTGPLHLATAVGTHVVGLYPSRKAVSPRRWGPLGEQHRVIQPTGVKCECPPKGCRCMDTISVERVVEEVVALYHVQSVG
ncbi:MAG TPA: glycosyltransferase family 9 protein [candidate division Zixibacteria bacterium]|nr:glycosyltransferase family 9 protein [candidate division Zixibacteria bacterium]MDD4918574.1 glycosyltransferase family 9 protein [candidate division Zixibacteria bacterium]MDM7971967.1 glycosyltransferase family 9 protein [candidate division Zixibacteria bacterium]HOD65634.1 glycosyltransferase family 9 protein [candidate division Zixibacteria bacterium]HPC12075.1 glycosyltransferase family 9 protein [candidate division Zixibacteria bacterium]